MCQDQVVHPVRVAGHSLVWNTLLHLQERGMSSKTNVCHESSVGQPEERVHPSCSQKVPKSGPTGASSQSSVFQLDDGHHRVQSAVRKARSTHALPATARRTKFSPLWRRGGGAAGTGDSTATILLQDNLISRTSNAPEVCCHTVGSAAVCPLRNGVRHATEETMLVLGSGAALVGRLWSCVDDTWSTLTCLAFGRHTLVHQGFAQMALQRLVRGLLRSRRIGSFVLSNVQARLAVFARSLAAALQPSVPIIIGLLNFS